MRARLLRPIQSALGRAGYTIAPTALTPPDMEEEFLAIHRRCAPHTMTSIERMYALWLAARHIRDIPGDVVECGVWRGGSSMLAALTLSAAGDPRTQWLYDTFEGMPPPSGRDVDVLGNVVADDWDAIRAEDGAIFARAPLDVVRANMGATGLAADRIHYVQGKVEDTIPAAIPGSIALLRLDTDWYESTRHELIHLWPLLAPGGVIIVDDYGHWAGAREAVDEYFADRPDRPLLGRIDYTGRMGIKPS